ncbi:universal stress protein [Dehalobacterium formicoaceticum]|uniref:Universal stress protein n=2 Tax=Dehalobacterium formicoaceticum TaxID=51515 RepID=A0ABT1Y8M9_9FIRM|nr:universal stress protein [Dehalobacterium formicoaceticum]MCR6546841.1 universal stress protein [Dehalobacterium formicoaceticum]
MFEKIMVAIDGSAHSMKAVDASIELAKKGNGQVDIIYVTPVLAHYMRDSAQMIVALGKKLTEEANSIMEEATNKFKDSGVEYITTIKTGDAADVIIREAEEKGTQVIVMGSRGLGAISRFVIGSVSTKVLTHAPCSVFIIR